MMQEKQFDRKETALVFDRYLRENGIDTGLDQNEQKGTWTVLYDARPLSIPLAVKRLTTPARCRVGHDKSQDLPVVLMFRRWGSGQGFDDRFGQCCPNLDNRWVLRIEGSPATWYCAGLLDREEQEIAIDFGADWYCTNIQEIMREARDLI